MTRAERLFVDYLGEPDIPYIRDVARMFFTAAVYRIMTPGHKWDNMLMIQGPQGCGKSTLCSILGWNKYHGELHARLDEYSEVNIEFHQAIIRMSGNGVLLALAENLFTHMRMIRRRTIGEQDRAVRSIRDHLTIIEALEARDTARAEALVRDHALGLADHVARHADYLD